MSWIEIIPLTDRPLEPWEVEVNRQGQKPRQVRRDRLGDAEEYISEAEDRDVDQRGFNK